ncbi:unnamed protein product [Cunninghamella blakesleeana]
MSAADLPPIPPSYYENFIESLAQIVSKLLTDKETEAVLSSIRSFQERLKRLSSQNLSRLNLEITKKEPSHYCKHVGKTCTQNCTRGFLKAYVVAFGVKYLIGVLPLLFTGKLFKKPSMLRRLAGRDTALFALFLSTFLSSYKGILCLMRRLRGTKDPSDDRLNAFIAGTVAGLSLLIDPDKRRRQSIMLYLLTRSLQFNGAWLMKVWAKSREHRRQLALNNQQEQNHHSLHDPSSSKSGGKRFTLGDEPQPIKEPEQTWEDKLAKALQNHVGVLVMMLANMQIIYAFLFDPDTLPKSYYAFLVTHSGWKGDVGNMAYPLAAAIGATADRLNQGDPSLPYKIPADMTSREFVTKHISPNVATIIPPNIHHSHTLCALQHPLEASCTMNKIRFFKDEYGRSMKLYVPLNVIMTLVFRYNQLKKDPVNVLKKMTKSAARSCFFLASYVTMAFVAACIVRNVAGKERLKYYYIPGIIGGSMAMFEAKGRQLELGLYCLTRAIESWWRSLVKYGYAKNIPHGDVLLFMLSMGTLMTIYQNDKDTIASHYLSVMTRFFGTN